MSDDWLDSMEKNFENVLNNNRLNEGIIIIDPEKPIPNLEETVNFRTLNKQMTEVDNILKLERAKAATIGEEETLYTDRSGFIRAAIAREIRRYKEEFTRQNRKRKEYGKR